MAVEPFLGTRSQKAFLFTIIIQALVVLTMVAIVYGEIDSAGIDLTESRYKTIPCYLALFAFAEIFEVSISLDALRGRNTIQLVGILLFHSAMIVMSGLQISQTHDALVIPFTSCEESYGNCGGPNSLWNWVLRFLLVVPCVLALSLVVLVWVTRALFAEFGWAVFHATGADIKRKTMYQYYQIMICLLKFDFFFFVGVTMQLIILVLASNKTEFILTIIAIPIVLILLFLCALALQQEIPWMMVASLVLMIASETYFIFKLVRFYAPDSRDIYDSIRGSLTVFTICAALLLLLTLAVGVRCFADFGQGLKQSKLADVEAPRKSRADPTFTGKNDDDSLGHPLQQRVSIE